MLWLQPQSGPPFAILLHLGVSGHWERFAASCRTPMGLDTSSASHTTAPSDTEVSRTPLPSPPSLQPRYSASYGMTARAMAHALGYSSFSPRVRMVCLTRLLMEEEVWRSSRRSTTIVTL